MSEDQKNQSTEQKKQLATQTDEHFIGHYNHAPDYMKDNHNITHGYRINFNTPKKILRSLFMIHNESVNIWTHLGTAIVIISIVIYFVVFMSPTSITQELTSYKNSISQNLDQYLRSIENTTILLQMKNFQQTKSEQFKEFKDEMLLSIFAKYQQIGNQINNQTEQFLNRIEGMQEKLTQKFTKNLNEFKKSKLQFQKITLPLIFDEIDTKLNSQTMMIIKKKITQLKDKFDSDTYNYIEFTKTIYNPNHISRWPLMVFLVSAFICLMCSTIFHLFHQMSDKYFKVFSRLDYAGISILIAGSGFPQLYYGMYCNLYMGYIYLSISTFLGLMVFLLSLTQWFHRKQNLHLKGIIYVGYGLHYAVPVFHILIDQYFFDNYGDSFNFSHSFPYILLLGSSYIIGCFIYVQRCPQRYYPGKVNLCGHSHQIWHGFTVLGIMFTYIAALINFELRKVCVCPVQ